VSLINVGINALPLVNAPINVALDPPVGALSKKDLSYSYGYTPGLKYSFIVYYISY
jgi:hypothetical protein